MDTHTHTEWKPLFFIDSLGRPLGLLRFTYILKNSASKPQASSVRSLLSISAIWHFKHDIYGSVLWYGQFLHKFSTFFHYTRSVNMLFQNPVHPEWENAKLLLTFGEYKTHIRTWKSWFKKEKIYLYPTCKYFITLCQILVYLYRTSDNSKVNLYLA